MQRSLIRAIRGLRSRPLELFTDNTLFDNIPSLIPFKGETLSREGVYWFERAARMGIKTHFLEYQAPAGMLCKKVDILQPQQITSQSKNYLIPLEWICRWYVAGLSRPGKRGKGPARTGFAPGTRSLRRASA
jgi:phosphoribosylaminoimidazole-succinocarboxamide synthase